MIKKIIQALELPKNEILYLHVRLKELSNKLSYSEQAKQIIGYLEKFYQPETILIPTFTDSFTKSRVYDRVNSPSEAGRFSEEVRQLYSFKNRTMNPMVNHVDTELFFQGCEPDDSTAFGINSYLDILGKRGHLIININLDEMVSTHLHYLEYKNDVDYRYDKVFKGKISENGRDFNKIIYTYYVRNLDLDTVWRRAKIERFLLKEKVLKKRNIDFYRLNWLYSKNMDAAIRKILSQDIRFLIKD